MVLNLGNLWKENTKITERFIVSYEIMIYRFRYNARNYEDCDNLEKINELIQIHDYFIISIIDEIPETLENTSK